jgi:hypothetical protein
MAGRSGMGFAEMKVHRRLQKADVREEWAPVFNEVKAVRGSYSQEASN